MSELKVYVKPIKTNMFGKMIVGQSYYNKSEADKVIEDKDAKILALDAEVFKQKHHAKLFFDERNYAETHLRHQKYKRCVAMAGKCRLHARWFGDNSFYKKEQWALKWHRRWLELAKKFKEAK